MAPPSKYGNDEEEESLLESEGLHSYPPAASSTSSRSLVLHLRPLFPLSKTIKPQEAVSIIGRSREEALSIALDAFPELKSINENRITFSMPSDPSAPIVWNTVWARITQPAWAGLHAEGAAPKVMRINIREEPREEAQRKRREFWLVAGPIGGGVLFFLILVLWVGYLAS